MNRNDTLGVLELSSIALGYAACDAMLKNAAVDLILSRTICSGKYLIVVAGDVASVSSSVHGGAAVAAGGIIEEHVLTGLHPAVFPALGQEAQVPEGDRGALGIVETFSATSAIGAADAGAKTADVTLLRIQLAMALGGKGYTVMTGDIASVQEAVEAGARVTGGMLAGKTVIPAPHEALFREFI